MTSSTVRLRYGRIAAFAGSFVVTATTVLAGTGVLPDGGTASYASSDGALRQGGDAPPAARLASATGPAAAALPEEERTRPTPVPADSGEGRRVVFDMSDQRVWLVRADGSVERSYLVSGSVYDNLDAGSYEVYSRSKEAIGIDDSGTMRFMVRFAHGDRAAIGFHDIPVDDGELVQTRAQLGTPLSHGCIRQWRPDARALWRFAPVGTSVVVTA
ncbi:MAG TPA: L,D-transpeptidase [Marmoricola sp.]|nr:L,D-transpeptidase [Marmoricola sp.]